MIVRMIGLTVGQYRILAEIGRGSMGIVFKAADTVGGRDAALKIIAEKLVDDPGILRRFERECRAASALHHPNICTVYDTGEWKGRPYLAMELLIGGTLDHRLKAGTVAGEQLIEIGVGVASALEASHAIGVVHRDIKPANLFLTATGHIKVLDFGLAKEKLPPRPLKEDSPTLSMVTTRTGMIVGSLPYMAPEQVRAEPLDGRADLYSLGVVLYELATGDLPLRGTEDFGRLPSGLGPVVRKLLAPDVRHRYQSAAEARKALQDCAFARCGIRRGL